MTGLKELIIRVAELIHDATLILAGVAVLVFFWGLAKFVFQRGSKDNLEEGRNIMIWGVIAIFVMTSVWGIIKFFQVSLGFALPGNRIDAPPDYPGGDPDDPFDPGGTNI